MPLETLQDFEHRNSRHLCIAFTRALIDSKNLAEFLEMVLPGVGRVFGTSRVSLVDYREHSDQFVLLHFEGYGHEARFELQRRMPQMKLREALKTRLPYRSSDDPRFLVIPFYLRDILEAMLILEYDEPSQAELGEAGREAAQVVSRMLGLLMSSARLKVNQDQTFSHEDLRKARQIQLSYLPGNDRTYSDICEVHGYNRSSALVGGDYFDYFCTRPGTLQGVLADACGHGMAAALIVSTFRGLLHSEMGRRSDFSGLFDYINRSIHSGDEYIQYLTGVFFDFDEKSRRLYYCNAGHYDPLIISPGGKLRTLPGGGPPLGMFKESTYGMSRTELQQGDLLALFTDGLIDLQNPKGEFFGVEGLTGLLTRLHDRPLNDISQGVLDEAHKFGGRVNMEDDVTLFLMRVH
ncbi:MAG TPA: PP2C family protein-serine/threonine phosphatase [Acidobacteriota bacterium]|nr:PP2C family protein-serine/threonine phosphatase [Acidobacteriota bacterium]